MPLSFDNMASTNNGVSDRKYELHNKLYKDMKDTLTQEEFQDLKNLCEGRFIRRGQLERIKTVTELLKELEKKGVIGVDKGYVELKKLLTESGLESYGLLDDILKTEAELDDLNQEYGGSNDVFPVPVQRAHSSHTQLDSLRRRRISDPGNVSLNVKRQRFGSSRTESDADTDNVYPTSPEHHNLLLIINQFTGEREGGKVDIEALDDLFRNTLRFSIIVKQNLNKQNFVDALSATAAEIKRTPFKYDRLFVAILSHGCEKGIKTCANPRQEEPGQFMTTEEIIYHFKSCQLPEMAGKPKVFLIQACFGHKHMNGVETDNEVRSPLTTRGGRSCLTTDQGGVTRPDDADFLICKATTEHHVSYRDRKKGSWFIQHLVEVFREKYQKDHVLDMMLEVNKRVAHEEAVTPEGESSSQVPGPKKQVPCQISTLTSKIFLCSHNN